MRNRILGADKREKNLLRNLDTVRKNLEQRTEKTYSVACRMKGEKLKENIAYEPRVYCEVKGTQNGE